MRCPAFLAPLRKLRAGQLDHLVTQGNDEPAAFSDGYEAVRVDETEFRMLPANQGLIANDAHVIKPDLRLIVQDQLVLPERFGKTLFQLELLHIYHIQGGVIEAVLTTPGTLGRVHGRVCIAQQRIHVLRIPWADRDAYAWTGVYLIAFQLIERRKSLGELVHPVDYLLFGTVARQQDNKFIPSEARGQITGFQHAGDTPGNRLQQQVADPMSQGIVDGLEAIQIDEQYRQQPAAMALIGQRPGPHCDELAAIVQSAQVVSGGRPAAALMLSLQPCNELPVLQLRALQYFQRQLLAADHSQHAPQAEDHHQTGHEVDPQLHSAALHGIDNTERPRPLAGRCGGCIGKTRGVVTVDGPDRAENN